MAILSLGGPTGPPPIGPPYRVPEGHAVQPALQRSARAHLRSSARLGLWLGFRLLLGSRLDLAWISAGFGFDLV